MQKNTTQALQLAQKGLRWAADSDGKAAEIFGQIIELLKPLDAREEQLEPAVKRAVKKAKG